MGVPGSVNNLLGAVAAGGYQVSRSLRFNRPDTAYLNKTFGSAGNRKTWTWSGWVKNTRYQDSVETYLFGSYSGNNDNGYTAIYWLSTGVFRVSGWSQLWLETTQVFRDFSAWGHLVISIDTTSGTANNRVRLYWNGVEITAFSVRNNPSQNADLAVNAAAAHQIGAYPYSPTAQTLDGYLADIHFIDGQALDPSSFAETNATTGQWIPKAYTGSYGTNGFRLTFSDNSGTTSTTLGKDAAGSNNWTPNNFSVASGSGNDSLVDSPTSYGTDTGAGGEVRGNYATLNPLDKNASLTPSNGNLDIVGPSTTHRAIRATISVSTGKWYWEITINNYGSGMLGIAKNDASLADGQYVGANASSWGYNGNANKYTNGSSSSYGATFTTGDVIGVAFDADNGTLTFYKNNSSQGTAYSGLTSGPYFPAVSTYNSSDSFSLNFGQRQWAYAPPSGFRALCATNLTAPTIAKPADYFDVKLYTGNGSSITVSGYNFSPDFVWTKSRSVGNSHAIWDAVRGVQQRLIPNDTVAEATRTGGLTAFTSDGFTHGSDATGNESSTTFVAWAWDAASSNSTNTSGTITSTVRANATAGFSIVTYTGSGSAATVGHGLGAVPGLIIVKDRTSGSYNWQVYHKTFAGTSNTIVLNATYAVDTGGGGIWNSTTPTSTVFSIGTSVGVNTNGNNYVAYVWSPVTGYSSFGSYTGNGSTDGPFVFTGMRPRFILWKRTDTTSDWTILDTARGTYNTDIKRLFPNLSSAEDTGQTDTMDILSNGFKLRTTGANANASGGTYIYASFAEFPFAYARAR